MKITTLPAIIFLALAMFILNACSSTDASLAGEWQLASYGNASNPTPAITGVETSIHFNEDGTFGGTVGCNTFGADYTAKNNTLQIGSIFSTLMFCEQTSAQESAVLTILSDQTLTTTLNSNRLTLTSADGASVIILEKK